MQIGAGLTLSGSTISVSVANSITIAGSGNGSVQLVNDEVSPGNSMFYGTSGAGEKGWYSLSDEGVDSITGTAGQVLANGTSGSAEGGAVTLTLATALVSINSVTSVAGQPLVLATGTSGTALSIASATNIASFSGSVYGNAGGSAQVSPTTSPSFFVGHANAVTANVLGSGNSARAMWMRAYTDGSNTGTWVLGYQNTTTFYSLLTIFGGVGTTTSIITCPGTTASTSTSTGSLINGGGFGNAGAIFAGGSIQSATSVILTSAATAGVQIYNTADQSTNTEQLQAFFASNIAHIGTKADGTGTGRALHLYSSVSAGGAAFGRLDLNYQALPFLRQGAYTSRTGTTQIAYSTPGTFVSLVNCTATNSSSTTTGLLVSPLMAQTGTGGYTAFRVSVDETGNTGSGTKRLAQFGTNSDDDLFIFDNSGAFNAVFGVGIGTGAVSVTTPLNIVKTVNNEIVARVENTNTGTGAQASIRIAASGGTITYGVNGSNYTTSGLFLQDGAYILADSSLSNGLTMGTRTTSSVIFATNDAARGRFTGTGEFITLGGQGWGVTNTATAAGTTTLTAASTIIRIFTGTSTQNCQLPAANAQGAGIAIVYVIKNRSTGSISVLRAGSDTIDGATSYTILSGDSITIVSNGVDAWVIC